MWEGSQEEEQAHWPVQGRMGVHGHMGGLLGEEVDGAEGPGVRVM